MEQLVNKKYKMSNPSETKLSTLGFRKIKNTDDDLWEHRFPVYKHNHKITTIEGVITVTLSTGKVLIDVYSNDNAYSPFYNNEFGNYEPILEIINKNILREFNKFGIKEKKKKNKTKLKAGNKHEW